MKYHDKNILCLTYNELVPEFITKANYDKLRQRGKLLVYGYGGIGREVLINYEALTDDRKAAIKDKYGDPYQYVVKQPLKDWVQLNFNKKAFNYYNKEYTLPSGLNLPEDYRDKYTTAVTYMDAIDHYTTFKPALKRDFNINMASFWKICADVIKAEKVGLPPNETRLKEKIKKYKAEGFISLVEAWRFGNDNSKKVKDELAEAVLMKLVANGNKLDDEVVAATYSQWAADNGRKAITGAAVAYRRRNNYHEVAMERDGAKLSYNTYSKQTGQYRPTSPLMLLNSDDNVLDLYFKDVRYVEGRKVVNNYYRPVMYVVTDCFNGDYVLGYAVGEKVTIELIKEAYRNAIAHIVELTGAAYLPKQIKSDKWSIDPKLQNELPTFFKMGGDTTFFPAAVAQSKYIERVFNNPLHKILRAFPNYSGKNITAKSKNSRVNTEALQKRTADFPDKKRVPEVVEMVINSMRHTIMPGTERTRQEIWREAFMASEHFQTKAISRERQLELLGVKHTPREPVRLQVTGLRFQVDNVKYHFDIPASLFPEKQNKQVQLIYDPNDMTKILVTDNQGLRFVADKYVYQPAAIADMKPGDGERLHERNQDKKRIAEKLTDFVIQRDEILSRAEIDANSLLQANVLSKAINHKAIKTLTGDTGSYDDAPVVQLPAAKQRVLVEHEPSIYDEM